MLLFIIRNELPQVAGTNTVCSSDLRVDSLEKTLMLGGIGGRTTEGEMAGWHHWLNGRESEWTPGVGDGQGRLLCCSPWGCKESDMTEWVTELTKCYLQEIQFQCKDTHRPKVEKLKKISMQMETKRNLRISGVKIVIFTSDKIALEEGMATYSSILAWRIPWTEEPGGLQSVKLQRVKYDWTHMHF